MITATNPKKTIVVCDTQPVTALGVKAMVECSIDLQFLCATSGLSAGLAAAAEQRPDLLMVDKAFGVQAILEWLTKLQELKTGTAVIVWGHTVSEPEALRFLQHGARGIVRKTSDPDTIRACCHSVASGATWMEDVVFSDILRKERYPRSELTPREQQVMELVEQGLKNKDIGRQLGIRPGTVKIHLKHIFEKTGVRGRYGLALSGFKDKGTTSLMTV
jgi:DNA-binding NarL/FixJ family response regulator